MDAGRTQARLASANKWWFEIQNYAMYAPSKRGHTCACEYWALPDVNWRPRALNLTAASSNQQHQKRARRHKRHLTHYYWHVCLCVCMFSEVLRSRVYVLLLFYSLSSSGARFGQRSSPYSIFRIPPVSRSSMNGWMMMMRTCKRIHTCRWCNHKIITAITGNRIVFSP